MISVISTPSDMEVYESNFSNGKQKCKYYYIIRTHNRHKMQEWWYDDGTRDNILQWKMAITHGPDITFKYEFKHELSWKR